MILAIFDPLATPHVAPYPTSHPNTCRHVFCIQQAQKTCFITRLWVVLQFLKCNGGMSIFAILGPFWPTLGISTLSSGTLGAHLNASRESSAPTTSPKIWQTQSAHYLFRWNTSLRHLRLSLHSFINFHDSTSSWRWRGWKRLRFLAKFNNPVQWIHSVVPHSFLSATSS